MSAALRRVRGVVSVDIDRRLNEAAVVRRQGTAPGTALVQAVRRSGYTASVIPTMRLQLDVPEMDCQGCPEKVQQSLISRRGVRGVHFPTRTQVVVFYDGRRLNQDSIVRTIRGTGISCGSKDQATPRS